MNLEFLLALKAMGAKSATVVYDNIASGGSRALAVEFFPPTESAATGPIVPHSMTQNAPEEESRCACGHALDVAHDTHGACLLGCNLETCLRTNQKAP